MAEKIIARLGGQEFPHLPHWRRRQSPPDYGADWGGQRPPEDAKALADRRPDVDAAARLITRGS